MKTCIKCGSHAFNLYAEEIDQGGLCDVHYWQGRAHRAEALAQPEQERVAWEQFYPDIGKPQLGQEPVAIYRAGQAKGEGFHVEFLKEMGDDEVLLYTTPPKRPWVGLTDEDTFEIGERLGLSDIAWVDLMQAIEAKLKELNT